PVSTLASLAASPSVPYTTLFRSGNAAGIGLADLMHQRLFNKIDLEKTYINVLTSLNPPMARLPIRLASDRQALELALGALGSPEDRKSTRLNSSHGSISYAVFCL